MPPVVFIGCVPDVYPGGVSFTLTNHARVQPGDQLLAIVCTDSSATGLTIPTGWSATTLLGVAADGRKVRLVRKEYAAGDPPTWTFTPQGVWSGIGKAALLTYRQLDVNAAIIAFNSTLVTASASIPCPSETLVKYSDLFLGIAYLNDELALTPPAGCTMRREVTGDGDMLSVFDFLAETPGATGIKTGTVGSPVTGIAISVALSALVTPPVSTLRADVSGAIGFTDIGV